MNQQSRNQLVAVIVIDSIDQLNKLGLSREEYDLRLKAMLRERLSESGQKELPV